MCDNEDKFWFECPINLFTCGISNSFASKMNNLTRILIIIVLILVVIQSEYWLYVLIIGLVVLVLIYYYCAPSFDTDKIVGISNPIIIETKNDVTIDANELPKTIINEIPKVEIKNDIKNDEKENKSDNKTKRIFKPIR